MKKQIEVIVRATQVPEIAQPFLLPSTESNNVLEPQKVRPVSCTCACSCLAQLDVRSHGVHVAGRLLISVPVMTVLGPLTGPVLIRDLRRVRSSSHGSRRPTDGFLSQGTGYARGVFCEPGDGITADTATDGTVDALGSAFRNLDMNRSHKRGNRRSEPATPETRRRLRSQDRTLCRPAMVSRTAAVTDSRGHR